MILSEESFAVRGYELDADALVPVHVWLRRMESLRWLSGWRWPEALRLGGGDTFMVVAQALRVVRDVGLGTDLTGRVWLGRFGRTSLDFWHAFHVDGDVVAAGMVTAVHVVDRRPAPLRETLRRIELTPALESVSLPEPMHQSAPPGAFCHPLRVRPADLDLLRHANHSSYSVFADAARHAAARAGAYGEASGRAAGRVTGIRIDYLDQALLDEHLEQATWLAGRDPTALGFELTRDGVVLSRARVLV